MRLHPIHNQPQTHDIAEAACAWQPDPHLRPPVVVPLVAGVADLVEAVHGGDVLGPGGGRGGHLPTQPGQILLVKLKINLLLSKI